MIEAAGEIVDGTAKVSGLCSGPWDYDQQLNGDYDGDGMTDIGCLSNEPAATPELMEAIATTKINPNEAFPEPLPIMEAAQAIAKADGYPGTELDKAEMERQWPQLKGQFLIDRGGIVRGANIECAEGLSGIGKFPPEQEILAAARSVVG